MLSLCLVLVPRWNQRVGTEWTSWELGAGSGGQGRTVGVGGGGGGQELYPEGSFRRVFCPRSLGWRHARRGSTLWHQIGLCISLSAPQWSALPEAPLCPRPWPESPRRTAAAALPALRSEGPVGTVKAPAPSPQLSDPLASSAPMVSTHPLLISRLPGSPCLPSIGLCRGQRWRHTHPSSHIHMHSDPHPHCVPGVFH